MTRAAGFCSLLTAFGCNSLTKLDGYSVGPDPSQGEEALCETNAACTDAATAAEGKPTPAVCVKSSGRCVKLLTEDCDAITGDYLKDSSVLIGSLFSTKGSQAATNIQRQQSAMLAVTQINAVGGVPAGDGTPRELVLLSCDESTNLERVGAHLVDELHVPAIVGPNTSQDTIDLSSNTTIPGGTVVMSPTAVASSVASLIDQDLTWLMVPSDVQRAPLMISQIGALEGQLKDERGVDKIKLGVVFRDDALGIGTRTSLNALMLNGKQISDPINLGANVHINPYDFSRPDQAEIVEEYLRFLPDIIVLAGTAEAISKVMVPLEERWPRNTPRPEYVLIDSVKVPELIMAASANDELRSRVRGTGIKPDAKSEPVYEAFKLDYQIAYPGSSIISGMGPAYDAAYAIAFALTATNDQPVSGAAVAQGLRRLSGGPTEVPIGATRVLMAFQKLAAGEKISATGTFSKLEWSMDGTVIGGTLEMWCIGAPAGTPVYQSSGLTFDIMTQTESGTFTPCGP